MKDIQNTTANTLSTIHGITFTVFFIVDTVLNVFLYPLLETFMHPGIVLAIQTVIAAVLYAIVFFIVKAIYDFILVKKDKRLTITGKWYHVHVPYIMGKEDYSITKLSCGTTKVSRNLHDFTFVGDNRKFTVVNGEILKSDDNATHWYTRATKLSDENDFDIIHIYEARTSGTQTREIQSCPFCKSKFDDPVEIEEAGVFRHGIHKIDIIEGEGDILEMKAEYSDCYPSFKNGKLFFYRTEQERDKRVKEFFACAEACKQGLLKS